MLGHQFDVAVGSDDGAHVERVVSVILGEDHQLDVARGDHVGGRVAVLDGQVHGALGPDVLHVPEDGHPFTGGDGPARVQVDAAGVFRLLDVPGEDQGPGGVHGETGVGLLQELDGDGVVGFQRVGVVVLDPRDGGGPGAVGLRGAHETAAFGLTFLGHGDIDEIAVVLAAVGVLPCIALGTVPYIVRADIFPFVSVGKDSVLELHLGVFPDETVDGTAVNTDIADLGHTLDQVDILVIHPEVADGESITIGIRGQPVARRCRQLRLEQGRVVG